MFLGVNQHWRVLPQLIVARGTSVIPRSLSYPIRPPISPPHRAVHHIVSASQNAQNRDTEEQTPQKDAHPRDLADRLANIPVRRHGTLESVLLPPVTVYPHRAETARARGKRHRLSRHQDLLESYYLVNKPRVEASNDWREILGILIAATPHNPPSSEASFEQTEPTVHDTSPEVAGDMKWTSYLVDDLQTGRLRPYRCSIRAEDIPKPEQWTKESLEDYVGKLVMSRVAKRNNLYETPWTHERAAGHQLVATFQDPDIVPALSLSAFKLALAHLARYEEFRGDAIKLLRLVTECGLKVDTQTFNILLEGVAANRNNPWLFYSLLKPMVRRGLQPDLWTWIMFFRLIKAEEVRRYILIIMAKKGLTRLPNTKAFVAAESVTDDVHRAAQLNYTLDEFLAQQRYIYQSHWLSNAWGSKALDAFGSYGRFDDMYKILELMFASEATRPRDEVPRITVLTHCYLHRVSFDWPARFLDLFERHNASQLAEQDYKCLFKMAYFMNKPQVLGVVWRHAMLTGKTTYYMRSRVLRLLQGGGRKNLAGLLEKLTREDDDPEAETEQAEEVEGAQESQGNFQGYIKHVLFPDFLNTYGLSEEGDDGPSAYDFMSDAMAWYERVGTSGLYKTHFSKLLLAANALDKDMVNVVGSGGRISMKTIPIFHHEAIVDTFEVPVEDEI